MHYIPGKFLEKMDDEELVYVNRNALNTTIAEYEIKMEQFKCEEELEILLKLWNRVYDSERKTKRINSFVQMKTKDVKRCFKNYKNFPFGSFYRA